MCPLSATQMLEYSVEISNYIELPDKSDLFWGISNLSTVTISWDIFDHQLDYMLWLHLVISSHESQGQSFENCSELLWWYD